MKLFSYGTINIPSVRFLLWGDHREGKPDSITGFKLAKNQFNLLYVFYTGDENDRVEGNVYDVTKKELKQTDRYEGAAYERRKVKTDNGLNAFVYVARGVKDER